MESRSKVAGHPAHTILIVFPLGLLATAVIFDVLFMITRDGTFSTVAFWNIVAGIIGGVIAALVGLIDFLAIPDDTRAKRIGLFHAVGNVIVLFLFAVSAAVRRENPAFEPPIYGFIAELIAGGLAVFTGWLGGELVDRLGVGVDRGANLDAPNSLSGKPASTRV